MAQSRKVIITCAVTGSIHTPTMTPYLPITPSEIAEGAIGAAEAGAAIIHLHARDPETGRPTPDPSVFMQFLPRIKQSCEAVVNITTGGGHGMSLEERLAAPLRAKPEMTSLNMGSMNFGLFPMLSRYKEFKYDWERQHLEASRDFIFRNTYKDIERIIKELGEGCGTRFEFECYDVGHLYNLAHFLERGLVKPPLVRADDLRHPRRHRRRPGEPPPHAADRRQAVRRRLPLVDPRRRPPPDPALHDGRDDGRERPGRPRGLDLRRQGRARQEQRRPGDAASAPSSKPSPSRSRPRPKPARMLALKGGDQVAF